MYYSHRGRGTGLSGRFRLSAQRLRGFTISIQDLERKDIFDLYKPMHDRLCHQVLISPGLTTIPNLFGTQDVLTGYEPSDLASQRRLHGRSCIHVFAHCDAFPGHAFSACFFD
ncbi:unnamed protein product [Chondrus crispus]|uniref:Uncharacterized protein n=1 Tax=Chondrus crispus TaxID=2769 RepID=R7QS98_CHOCR|nr:unnamed protein product [Chondrus crispus]CDF40265.1 unnamed protein product [Chondrus crispus]|eukprot:XP_005710559.1 unnamed protein product [Chondrus crispus]